MLPEFGDQPVKLSIVIAISHAKARVLGLQPCPRPATDVARADALRETAGAEKSANFLSALRPQLRHNPPPQFPGGGR